jgi:hypothetical protein
MPCRQDGYEDFQARHLTRYTAARRMIEECLVLVTGEGILDAGIAFEKNGKS